MNSILTADEKQILLKLARDTIEQYLASNLRLNPPSPSGGLAQTAGAFVTLHKRGSLRGCIGNLVGRGALVETIRDMAIAAATEDPRFRKVTLEEMEDIDIEISVLTPFKRIKDVSEITVGEHGLFIRKGMYQGILLPQVAKEYKWDRNTFLGHACLKAGLPQDAWKNPDTIIETFSAEVFGEKA